MNDQEYFDELVAQLDPQSNDDAQREIKAVKIIDDQGEAWKMSDVRFDGDHTVIIEITK